MNYTRKDKGKKLNALMTTLIEKLNFELIFYHPLTVNRLSDFPMKR